MNEAAGFQAVPAGHPALPHRRRPTLARVLRALLAVVVAVLLYNALAGAFEVLLEVPVPPPEGGEKLFEELVAVAAAMVVSGFVAAWVAGGWEVGIGSATGVILGIGAVRDGERYLQELSDRVHPLARLFGDGQGARAPELGLPVMGTHYTAEELCELIRAYAGGRSPA